MLSTCLLLSMSKIEEMVDGLYFGGILVGDVVLVVGLMDVNEGVVVLLCKVLGVEHVDFVEKVFLFCRQLAGIN